jgi:large subunit ribosomal protein L6
MSKIGKLPISIPSGVTVVIEGKTVTVTGTKGTLSQSIPSGVSVVSEAETVTVSIQDQLDRKIRALHGLTRANIANMVHGVLEGFTKQLELVGVGYRAQMQGTDLVLSLGFAHPVKMQPLAGVSITVAGNTITLSGIDKVSVGEMAAKIRAVRPPEPYKGKGIKYKGEHIRRKAGKAAKAGSK